MSEEKKHMDTLAEQMNYLKQKGFSKEFNIEKNQVISGEGEKYDSDDLKIREIYRFEGESNPDDSSDLYAIEANDGSKGLLITSRGAKHNVNEEIIKNINVERLNL